MTKLPAEAYAIIEGKHSDPFRYLGLHSEGGNSVVRAFIPEASNVEAIGEHGETAPLQRIHDAGLFAGALPNGRNAGAECVCDAESSSTGIPSFDATSRRSMER